MCHPTPCRTCGKITWKGCGMHVAQVRASVVEENWCPGHPDQPRRGLLDRLRGR